MVHPLDADFGIVESIEQDNDGNGVWLFNGDEGKIFAPVNWKFISG